MHEDIKERSCSKKHAWPLLVASVAAILQYELAYILSICAATCRQTSGEARDVHKESNQRYLIPKDLVIVIAC